MVSHRALRATCSRLATAVGVTALIGVAAGTAGTSSASGAGAVNGTIAGTAFRDYSANGQRDALEPGESGIVVTGYDAAGANVGTTTSAADGSYTLTVTGANDVNVRLEFAIPAGKQGYLQPGPIGTGSSGSVRFTTVAATGQDFGVHNPAEYCQANPTLVTGCLAYGHQQGAVATAASLRSFPYDATGASFNGDATATAASVASHAQVGSTFALEYSRTRAAVYSAAFQKQYAGFGPGGPGEIGRAHV